MSLASRYAQADRLLATLGGYFQPLLLLVLRAWWGWQFFLAGKGKLLNLDQPTAFFAEIGIPAPRLNAIAAGSVECFGGALLLLGLFSRPVALALAFTMSVAYVTAHRPEVRVIFSNPDEFTGAPPFLFLLTALIVFAVGPGKLSLDALFFKRTEK